jgi:hypothetical protein
MLAAQMRHNPYLTAPLTAPLYNCQHHRQQRPMSESIYGGRDRDINRDRDKDRDGERNREKTRDSKDRKRDRDKKREEV